MIKTELNLEDEVIIHSTNDKQLDNQHGIILGKLDFFNFNYIVLLEEPYENINIIDGKKFRNKAIVLNILNLEKINK